MALANTSNLFMAIIMKMMQKRARSTQLSTRTDGRPAANGRHDNRAEERKMEMGKQEKFAMRLGATYARIRIERLQLDDKCGWEN